MFTSPDERLGEIANPIAVSEFRDAIDVLVNEAFRSFNTVYDTNPGIRIDCMVKNPEKDAVTGRLIDSQPALFTC